MDSAWAGANAAYALDGFLTNTPWWGWPLIVLSAFGLGALFYGAVVLYQDWEYRFGVAFAIGALLNAVAIPIVVLRNLYGV